MTAPRPDQIRALMTSGDDLDDVARARMWNAIDGQLAEPVARPARRAPALAIGLAAVAAAAAATVVIVIGRSDHEPGAPTLAAPAGTVLSSSIGPHARTALLGPAALDVITATDGVTEVRLRSGTLLVEFAGGPGRSLRVIAPGATIDVIGTVFAVEVSSSTCISVTHGRVRVTTPTRTAEVTTDQRLCTDHPAPTPIPPSTRDALRHHAPVETSRASDGDGHLPKQTELQDSAGADRSNVSQRDTKSPKRPSKSSESKETDVTQPTSDRVHHLPKPPEVLGTAEEAYREAEAALATGDTSAADRALARVIAEAPGSGLVEQAIYERARIAYQRRAWTEARRHLDRLAALPPRSLAEPGRYLECRIAVEAGDADAARCLADYRAAYPGSPHDLEVLGLLAQLAHADGGCTPAAPHVDELGRGYPRSALARAWRARCPETP
jgi:hypothetical protein